MVLGIILGIIVAIIILCIVASEFANIAAEKGHNGTKYFWFTIIFGILGAIMVAALPDRKEQVIEKHLYNNGSQAQRTPSANEWKCSKCGSINQNYVGTCGCGQVKPR